eukprot:3391272-Rhodomonas_salina.1
MRPGGRGSGAHCTAPRLSLQLPGPLCELWRGRPNKLERAAGSSVKVENHASVFNANFPQDTERARARRVAAMRQRSHPRASDRTARLSLSVESEASQRRREPTGYAAEAARSRRTASQ